MTINQQIRAKGVAVLYYRYSINPKYAAEAGLHHGRAWMVSHATRKLLDELCGDLPPYPVTITFRHHWVAGDKLEEVRSAMEVRQEHERFGDLHPGDRFTLSTMEDTWAPVGGTPVYTKCHLPEGAAVNERTGNVVQFALENIPVYRVIDEVEYR